MQFSYLFFLNFHFRLKKKKEKKLGGEIYYEQNTNYFCEEDYNKFFVVKCDQCHQPITQEYITILGKNYHGDCFLCAGCQKAFKGFLKIL